MKQIPLAIGPEPARTFGNFLPGPNAAALAHLAALAPGAPPVYLWGPPGSGKTHLLHAAIERAQGAGERAALFGAGVPAPWSLPERSAVVAIDDGDALDAEQQAAAFSLFVTAAEGGGVTAADGSGTVVIAAGLVPPVDLAVREDLRTRLGWGHVFALQPLAEPEVRSALRREGDRRGTFLSDDVMDHLLSRFARDLKHLMALLDRLDVFALSNKRAITVPLLRQMLAEDGAGAAPGSAP